MHATHRSKAVIIDDTLISETVKSDSPITALVPTNDVTVAQWNNMVLDLEDLEAVNMCLDDVGIPRTEGTETLSLWGRILKYGVQCAMTKTLEIA